ncbi:hypothetical protein Dda_5434 [Drechslerella dactyloides]|uniref:Uncharacterized protein n=1 Tax=Drechslerella dactyloides TaxID=74499 RepID=A0AAD6NK81_DREDA|nr:hypothetical protein Dda_5434 [Drechslerella dactyloides]
MRRSILTLLLSYTLKGVWASPIALAQAGSQKCDADNCLRAVRNSVRAPTGINHCSSYFLTTVTPAVVTVTTTNTISVTATSVVDATETDNVEKTLTVEAHHTATNVIPATETVTATAYKDPLELRKRQRDHPGYPLTYTRVSFNPIDLEKRQQTAIPSVIPAYASACSGQVRYSSACSCMGVTASTVTVAASTTTVTTSTTVTVSTETQKTIVATDFVDVTVATATKDITDTTVAVTSVVATAMPTEYIKLSQRFAIQVQGSSRGNYVLRPANNEFLYVGNSDAPLLWEFNAHTTSIISSGKPLIAINAWLAPNQISVITGGAVNQNTWGPVFTSIDPTDFSLKLYWSDGTTVAGTWTCILAGYPAPNGIAAGDANLKASDIDNIDGVDGCEVITLKAVPVPF